MKDVVSGYAGVVTSRTEHISYCNTYGVQGNFKGDYKDPTGFDENRLELVKSKAIKIGKESQEYQGPGPVPKVSR